MMRVVFWVYVSQGKAYKTGFIARSIFSTAQHQSTNLSVRFINYFNMSYLASKKALIISRALIKYGYSGFSLEILFFFNCPCPL
jgi:hypothetical protein